MASATNQIAQGKLFRHRGAKIVFNSNRTQPQKTMKHNQDMTIGFALKPAFKLEPRKTYHKISSSQNYTAVTHKIMKDHEYLAKYGIAGYDRKDFEMDKLPIQENNDPPLPKEPKWNVKPEGGHGGQARGVRYRGFESMDFWGK